MKGSANLRMVKEGVVSENILTLLQWRVIGNSKVEGCNPNKKSLILAVLLYNTQGRCLLIKEYFSVVYDYGGKADLRKGYWN